MRGRYTVSEPRSTPYLEPKRCGRRASKSRTCRHRDRARLRACESKYARQGNGGRLLGHARHSDLRLPQPKLGEAEHYQQLETGARWMASRSSDEAERHEHLAMATKYARLRLDAAGANRR